jgi:hypothetical protein
MTIAPFILSILIGISGCATPSEMMARSVPIAENGKPLSLNVISITSTRDPQPFLSIVFRGYGDAVLRDQTPQGQSVTTQVPPEPLQTYVIIKFTLSNISNTLRIYPSDMPLLGNDSTIYKPLAKKAFQQWVRFIATTIPSNSNDESYLAEGFGVGVLTLTFDHYDGYEEWIYMIPDSAINGSSFIFQGNTYSLNDYLISLPVRSEQTNSSSCADQCKSQYSKGEFKAGITIEDCIKATCK